MTYEEIYDLIQSSIKKLSQSGINSKKEVREDLEKALKKLIEHQIEYLSNKDLPRKAFYKLVDIIDNEGNFICEKYEKEFNIIEEIIKEREERMKKI
jgi:hypothetical protein